MKSTFRQPHGHHHDFQHYHVMMIIIIITIITTWRRCQYLCYHHYNEKYGRQTHELLVLGRHHHRQHQHQPRHHHHHDYFLLFIITIMTKAKVQTGNLGAGCPPVVGHHHETLNSCTFLSPQNWAHHLHHLYHCPQRLHQLHHHHHHHHRQKVQTANWLPTAMATQFLALYFSFRRHTHLPVFIVFNPKLSSLDFWQNHGLLWGLQESQRIVGI